MKNIASELEVVDGQRRNLLKSAGTLTVAAAAGLTYAGLAQAMQHGDGKHDHSAMVSPLQGVVDASSECLKMGEICREHCIQLFKSGDTTVAECADAVNEMLASCTAMTKLAIYNSRHIKDFMHVCKEICGDCEKACGKHADVHAECKACAEACGECIKAISAALA